MSNPIILSIVGHTNVGKTSLLRTLSRNSQFGEVSTKPGTTKHTEGIRLYVGHKQVIELYDTPGLEDSMALYDYLDSLATHSASRDSYARIQLFLAGPEAKGRFEQEAKVVRQLAKSDAGLYVIDVREPVLPKYRDELDILAHCGKPLLPVLNFTWSEQSHEAAWRQMLSQLALHVIVHFDTVSPPIDGEKKLYESLILLIPSTHDLLLQWLQEVERQRLTRQHAAMTIIAEALIDVTAAVSWIDKTLGADIEIDNLRNKVREREQTCIKTLLTLYQFDIDVAKQGEIPLLSGRFSTDLFSTDALKQMGISLSKGAVAGAVTGAGIDLAVGGLTLGTAAVFGAILGGLSISLKHYGKQLSQTFSHMERLTVDDAIICLLGLRLQTLYQALEQRGHAAQTTLSVLTPTASLWQKGKLTKPLSSARAHPKWSTINLPKQPYSQKKQRVIHHLSQQLLIAATV